MNGRKQSGKKYPDPPSAREGRSWQRSSNYQMRGVVGSRMASQDGEDDSDATMEEERLAYEKSKRDYQLWTTATTAICFTAIYSFYPRVSTYKLSQRVEN